MEIKDLCVFLILFFMSNGVSGILIEMNWILNTVTIHLEPPRNMCYIKLLVTVMSKQQLKNSLKMLKKNCMAKHQVTEEQIGSIDKGKFMEDNGVMCYIACIYQMSQVVKNNKLSYEASIKQIDMMYPPELKDAAKASVNNCKDVSSKYKDLCEASYWTAKCMYEDNPKAFIFA